MVWSKETIEKHCAAAKILNEIKDIAFNYISLHHETTEREVQDFIFKQFKEKSLETNSDKLIVAFNESSAAPHYYPDKKSRKLQPESVILIDIWGKIKEKNSPYADITWMGYYGNNIPREFLEMFKILITGRDAAISFLRAQLNRGIIPSGKDIDLSSYEPIIKNGFESNILHRTGHSLGFNHPHGHYPSVSLKNSEPLLADIIYTIEPGIYIKGKYGLRSEIDFYITKNKRLIVTTPIQREIVTIKI